MTSRRSSGSMRRDSAVEPTRSENITVTWRRSAWSSAWARGLLAVVFASTDGVLPRALPGRVAIASSSLSRCPTAVTPSSFRVSCVRLGRTVSLLLLDVVHRRSGGVDIGLRLTELRVVVVVNDIDDGIARVNPLKVLNVDGFDVSGNFGCWGCRIRLQKGMVGGWQPSRANPPVPLVGDKEDQTSDQK